jgi:hypothetical protein
MICLSTDIPGLWVVVGVMGLTRRLLISWLPMLREKERKEEEKKKKKKDRRERIQNKKGKKINTH